MKKALILLLIVTHSIYTQNLSKEMISAFKFDDSTKLMALVGQDNLNNCYSLNGNSYGLLALAIKSKANNCLERLLQEKSIAIEKACESKTPLLYAVKYGRLKMLKLLITNGANHNVITNKGRTAKDYATKYQRPEVLKYLKSLD
jgi:ankyrin repeat protein